MPSKFLSEPVKSSESTATIGLIGLGRMGARLAEAAEAAGVRVVAALDTADRPFALEVRPDLAPVFIRDTRSFWECRPDVVLISTTAPSHVPLLIEGIDAGVRRFVVEKPFCTGVAEGETACQTVSQSGARVVVNHGRRYCPNYSALAALDGTPQMGALRGISVTLGAGGLGTLGVHYLDLFNRLFGGLPQSATAVASGATPVNPRGQEFEDPGACALLIWPDGRRAVLDMCDDTGIPPLIEARFTYGRVLIENEAVPWRVFHRAEEDYELPLTRYGQPNEESPLAGFRPFGLIDMAAAAIRDALGDGPVVSDAGSALNAIRVFAAIRESTARGATVTLPASEAVCQTSFAIP
jgi:predicted dehydrogenase